MNRLREVEVQFEPEAAHELRAAARWYEERREGLGADLLVEVDRAMDRLLETPHGFPLVEGFDDVRRVLLDRFPYALVYMVHGDALRILSVAHGKRRPLFWAGRGR